MIKPCEECPGFLAISKQLDRVLDNQNKQFDKFNELGKRSAVITQRMDTHEKGHDDRINTHEKGHERGFSRVFVVVMAVLAFLALGANVLIAAFK